MNKLTDLLTKVVRIHIPVKRTILLIAFIIPCKASLFSQTLKELVVNTEKGLTIEKMIISDSVTINFKTARNLYSFLLNNEPPESAESDIQEVEGKYIRTFNKKIRCTYTPTGRYETGLTAELLFENISQDTLSISNVVPFGEDSSSVFITGRGNDEIARACLVRPRFEPVRVILPDNAWELGYCSFDAGKGYSLCSIARREKTENGKKHRYSTILPPGANVRYSIHTEAFQGDWQNGLRLIFRDRILFDTDKFDNKLYLRKDLEWIKSSYLVILQMAWDREFFDRFTGKYTYAEVIKKGNQLFGNIDVFGIWPTWPRLGLDQRNQWDLYRDLPGGIQQLHNFVKMTHQAGTKFFIAYNPWDNSTRKENHLEGMAKMISETESDGVVLDTQGSSSAQLQAAADSVRSGIIMYSEGMAVPRDMTGIISGRVHNAIYFSPELNLNKLIKPDFSIFRVCDVGEDIIHREIAVSFFNGYGTELNMFRPGGRDENYTSDLNFLASTTFILRQNNDAFLDHDWTPLITTSEDRVYVNRWVSGEKTLFTILNMRPDGIDGKLFKAQVRAGRHFVSIWNHENIVPVSENGQTYISSRADGWVKAYSGTRKEGSVDCIAEFPELIRSRLSGDSIKIEGNLHGKILIWKGNPSYQAFHKDVELTGDTTIRVKDLFGYYEGKIVLQLVDNKLLKDENVLNLKGGKPWPVSKLVRTPLTSVIPEEMVLIPGGQFSYTLTANDDFIPYPESAANVKVDSFLVDRYPVTNEQYYEFISNSGYRPSDTTRYLRNWSSGIYRPGQERYPVVYVSLEDMQAYAKWAGKRLPTESEWQLAAQGYDTRKWPWGDEFHGTYCNNSFGRSTPVDAFPKGLSPYGVFDMVGNVWQMTNDLYFNGTDYYSIIRGGSFFKPESSWWYIQGGPQPLDKTQMLLLVSQGYDRSSAVGFRCVKDIDRKKMRVRK